MPKPNGKPAALPEPWALPSVELHLDKPRRLSFPMPAIFKYEDRSGINLLEPPVKAGKDGKPRQMGESELVKWMLGDSARKRAENLNALCWAGCLADDCKSSGADPEEYWSNPPLKLAAIAMEISVANTRAVLLACMTALNRALAGEDSDRPIVAEAAVEVEAEKQLA